MESEDEDREGTWSTGSQLDSLDPKADLEQARYLMFLPHSVLTLLEVTQSSCHTVLERDAGHQSCVRKGASLAPAPYGMTDLLLQVGHVELVALQNLGPWAHVMSSS